MNQTMTAIALATRKALTALDSTNPDSFRWQTFGNGKYQVAMHGGPRSGYSVVVSYRGTAVVNIRDTGTIMLDTNRHHTLTTKNVINAALFGARDRAPFTVYQQDFQWYVHVLNSGEAWSTKTDLPFYDGMELLLSTRSPMLVSASA